MSDDIAYSFIVYEVSVTMDEQSIKDDLMGRYDGVEKVTRMFYEGDDDTPKTSVQVDFTIPTDAQKIYRDKAIVIGGICRRVYAIKKSAYQRSNRKPRENGQRKSKPLCEQDLLDMFEEQKQSLVELLNSFDEKLDDFITRREETTKQPVPSNKA